MVTEELMTKIRELVDLCAHCGFEWEVLDEVIELLEKENEDDVCF